MKYILTTILIIISFTSFSQSNYVNINQRYRWFAGKFDSGWHMPTFASQRLFNGQYTGAGAGMYETADSTFNVWTGYTWRKIGVVPQSQQNSCISGCTVTWVENYDYEVAESYYYINGVLYHSPVTTVTLPASDPTDDRIDLFVLTTSNTASSVTGTPATPPAAPAVDPALQLEIHLPPLTTVQLSQL